MKKNRILNKFKRILIAILCVITLFFSMPVKSSADAGILESIADFILVIPDGIQYILNHYMSDETEDVKNSIRVTVTDDDAGVFSNNSGTLYNFEVTPYDIFTAGTPTLFGEYVEYYNDYTEAQNAFEQNNQAIYNGGGSSVEAVQSNHDASDAADALNSYDVSSFTTKSLVKMPLLDANFFKKDLGENAGEQDSADILRPIVSSVYKNLRNLVLILMLVILLYIGIRIIISSAASEQVKYKQYLKDWVVGICLVFLMHYIMSAIMNVNGAINDMLITSPEGEVYTIAFGTKDSTIASIIRYPQKKANTEKHFFSNNIVKAGFGALGNGLETLYTIKAAAIGYATNEVTKTLDSNSDGWDELMNSKNKGTANFVNRKLEIQEKGAVFEFNNDTHTVVDYYSDSTPINAAIYDPDVGSGIRAIYLCNIAEYCRTLTTYSSKYTHIYSNNRETTMSDSDEIKTDEENDYASSAYWGYAFLYILITIETVVFLYKYMKRVLWLAFLTMIAPLIALMYPVDKVGDGKAQTFNMWFKEYLFNTLIQPLHILLYTIFIAVGSQLITTNVIYGIIAYAFMLTAEKFFKKMFGFDKASTPGGLGSPAAGLMAMRGLDRLGGWGPHGKGGKGGGKSENPKVKFAKDKLPGPMGQSSETSNSVGNAIAGRGGNQSGRAAGILAPSSLGSNSSGASALTSSRGAKNKTSRGSSTIFGGMLQSLDQRAARRITGGRSYSLGNAFKGHKLDMLKTGASAVGRRATRLAGGALGAVGGLAIGAVSGAMASALTGEDKFADALSKGGLTGAAVGYSRAGQVSDWAGNLYESGKQFKAAGDVAYGAKLTAEEIFKENPELFAGMSGDEVDNAMNAITAVGHYADKDDIVKNFDKIMKQYDPNNLDSAATIAGKIEYNNTFGNFKVDKNAQEAHKYFEKQIRESGMSEDEILNNGRNKVNNEIEKLKQKVKEETANGTKALTNERKDEIQKQFKKLEEKRNNMNLDSAINIMATDEVNKYRW